MAEEPAWLTVAQGELRKRKSQVLPRIPNTGVLGFSCPE